MQKSIDKGKLFLSTLVFLVHIYASYIESYSLLQTIPLLCIFLSLFSPSLGFVNLFLFCIQPLGSFTLGGWYMLAWGIVFAVLLVTNSETVQKAFKDRYFSKIWKISLLFVAYQLLFGLFLRDTPFKYYLQYSPNIFGILLMLPAYVYVLQDAKNVIAMLVIASILILSIYITSYFGITHFVDFAEGARGSEIDAMRYVGFDLRQVTKIWIYLFPLFLLHLKKHFFLKSTLVYLGVIGYVTLALALLRNEMFYTAMGTLFAVFLSFVLFHKTKIAKGLFFVVVLLFVVNFLFPNLLNGVYETFLYSTDNQSVDMSKDQRLFVQLPIAVELFKSNPLFGVGIYGSSIDSTGHHLVYDIPIVGSFATYGIAGILLYWLKYLCLYKRYKSLRLDYKKFSQNPMLTLALIGLSAYFMTMLLFRTFQVNLELAFIWGQSEFGFLIGAYYALSRKLVNQQNRQT